MRFGGLGQFANTLVAAHGFTRVAAVTSLTTGNPALRAFDVTVPRLFVSVQYEGRTGQGRGAQSVTTAVAALGLSGEMDLVIADPFHSYESSIECLTAALSLLRSGGVLLVHDCLPPLTLSGDTYQDGPWCGMTYAAFRDFCGGRGLEWCTVDADSGVGVVVADAVAVAGRQPASDLSWSRDQFEANPWVFMRAIAPANAEEAVQRLMRGRSVDDLLESAASPPPPATIAPEVMVQMLEQKVSMLQAQVADLARDSHQG